MARLVGAATGPGMCADAGIAEPVVGELEIAIETAAYAYLGNGLIVAFEPVLELLGVQVEVGGISCAWAAFA